MAQRTRSRASSANNDGGNEENDGTIATADAPEGSGFLLGVATYERELGRSDLLVFDAEHVDQGPVATVRMPTRIAGQVHGWWVPAKHLPPVPI